MSAVGDVDSVSRPLVIAIDGPSGSGKSSVSREVARRLRLEFVDTGATYRAVCWACLEQGVDLDDEVAVALVARDLKLELGTDPFDPFVRVDGVDVTSRIRESRISREVSRVATNLAVREELRARQRGVIRAALDGRCGGCVAEGRDVTTVVAPEAEVRILLTASERSRLARRALELHGSDDVRALQATHDEVVRRDAQDATVSSFEQAAEGVLEIDSSAMSFEETVQAVLDVVVATVSLGLSGDAFTAFELPGDVCVTPR